MISFEDANVTDWTVVRPRWSMMMALCAKNSIRLYTFLITVVNPNKGSPFLAKVGQIRELQKFPYLSFLTIGMK